MLGPLEQGAVPIEAERSQTCTGMCNSDGHYETGLAWSGEGVMAPYFGAFAECYTIPPGNKICAVDLTLCRAAEQGDQTLDVYLWENDGGDAPGTVISMVAGCHPGPITAWPAFREVRIPMSGCELPCSSGEQVWVGTWGNWPGAEAAWYVGADDTPGSQGCPMTNVSPGVPWLLPGWQSVNNVWQGISALGIGLEYVDCCRTPHCLRSTPVPSGIVAWWPGFPGDMPAPVPAPPAIDMISPPANGTSRGSIGGVTDVPGKVGNAFSFNTADAYVEVPDAQKFHFGTGDFSLEGWVCVDSVALSEGGVLVPIFQKALGGGHGPGITLHLGTTIWHLHVGSCEVPAHLRTPHNRWTFFAATVSRQGGAHVVTFYLKSPDGMVDAVKTFEDPDLPSQDVTNTYPITIGGETTHHVFPGVIDELTVYSRALSAAEVYRIYDAGCNGKQKPKPQAKLTIPSIFYEPFGYLCFGRPMVASAEQSLFATSYGWSILPVADDCKTNIAPYGHSYRAGYFPTWDFNETDHLPGGHFLIQLWAYNDCEYDMVERCVQVVSCDTADKDGPADALSLDPALPNPFTGMTSVLFRLPAAQPVTVEICDVGGRVLRRLVNRETSAGEHRLTWDGRDETGRQVASGLYFCRLRSAGRELSRTVMLVK